MFDALAATLFVMGDWGGVPVPPWHTPGELKIARAMGDLAEAAAAAAGSNISATLALGAAAAR